MTGDCPVLYLCWLGGEVEDGGNEREMDNTWQRGWQVNKGRVLPECTRQLG